MTARPPDSRLNPPKNHPRYYGLITLKNALGSIIEERIRPLALSSGLVTILDYGSGDSPYEPLFEGIASTYLRADVSGDVDIKINEPDGAIPVESNSVDVVLSTQVLEHVSSTSDYLREALRVTRDKGLLVLSTHGVYPYHPDPADYWRWTASGLLKILSESGWEVLSIEGLIGRAPSALFLLQDPVVSKVPKQLRNLTIRAFQGTIGMLDRRYTSNTRLNDATLYLVVAQPAS